MDGGKTRSRSLRWSYDRSSNGESQLVESPFYVKR